MEKFYINANIVLDFMIKNHYSEHSLSQYKRIYETMGEYLTENNLSYCQNWAGYYLTAVQMPLRIER